MQKRKFTSEFKALNTGDERGDYLLSDRDTIKQTQARLKMKGITISIKTGTDFITVTRIK